MEERILSAAEAAEFGEFKRSKREAEIALALGKLIVDASRRETDVSLLKHACESARRLNAAGVLVSPVNVAAASRLLEGSASCVCCAVGGTGESLTCVKKAEAKRAARQGAKEIRLAPCYSALACGNYAYVKKETRRIRRAVKNCALVLCAEDKGLTEEQVFALVRAAADAGAEGVCVRGETALLNRVQALCRGKLRPEAADVENGEQMRLLLKAGAMRAVTYHGDRIADDLRRAAEAELAMQEGRTPPPQWEEGTIEKEETL